MPTDNVFYKVLDYVIAGLVGSISIIFGWLMKKFKHQDEKIEKLQTAQALTDMRINAVESAHEKLDSTIDKINTLTTKVEVIAAKMERRKVDRE